MHIDEGNVVSPYENLTTENVNINRKAGTRIKWVDAGKCLGILMVMFGHNWLHPRYCYYCYAFHMPLFFILAGYTFSTKQNFGTFVKKKFKSLLIPYVTFAIVCSAFYLFLNYMHTGQLHLSGMSEKYLLRGTETFLWFLPTLFLSEILAYVLGKCRLLSTKILIYGILLILFLISYLAAKYYILDYDTIGCVRLVPLATSFIISGFLYKKYIEGYKLEQNWVYIILIVMTSVGLATYNYAKHNYTTMFSTGNFPIFVITALLASYGLILLLKKIRFPRWFLYIGVSSIVFYGFHRLVIEVCFLIYGRIGIEYDQISLQSLIMAVLNVLIACLIIYPVCKIIDKHAPWLLGKF